MRRKAKLTEIALPDYGLPRELPALDGDLYKSRLARLTDRLAECGLDTAVIYGDREHCANFAYLTGFDPRFEEAILIVVRGREPVIVTGPENLGLAEAAPIGARGELWPGFGLLGQDRSRTRTLTDVLASAGLDRKGPIGVIGWKYFLAGELSDPASATDLPAYLSAALAGFGSLVNATALMMDPAEGLRATVDLAEIARFEFLASHGSDSVRRVLTGLRPGMTELEAASLMRPLGLPLCCHPMLSTGERSRFGVCSPTSRIIARGDTFTTAFGYQGSLTARAGFVAEGPEDLPEGAKDYVDRLVGPYFEAAVEWYETIGLGVTGGEIDSKMRARLDNDFFRLSLNPGHLIHIDEWMNSPVSPGGKEVFRSRQMVQIDMIPATGSAYFTTNIEDGVALLDAEDRAAFAERFPEANRRIAARREFMADVLGIRLKPETMPLSNLSGFLPAYLLQPNLAMALH